MTAVLFFLLVSLSSLSAQNTIAVSGRVIDETGVWLRPFANFIYTMPPLVTDDASLRRITQAVSRLAACPPGPEVSGDFHE